MLLVYARMHPGAGLRCGPLPDADVDRGQPLPTFNRVW